MERWSAKLSELRNTGATGRVETQTTWILRAPPETGEFKLAAVFFYGTEKAHPLGTVVRNGQAEPRGGISGPSGRIMFSDVINISVR